ncbi:MAG: hypothetical protein ABUT20_21280 [Bacteroidota bacterium]
MKKILRSTILLIILAQLTSCFFPKNESAAGIWFYTFSSTTPGKDDSALTPASFLNLEENGTYTSEFAVFDYGIWKLSDRKIYLTNHKGELTVFLLLNILREMKCGYLLMITHQPILKDNRDHLKLLRRILFQKKIIYGG